MPPDEDELHVMSFPGLQPSTSLRHASTGRGQTCASSCPRRRRADRREHDQIPRQAGSQARAARTEYVTWSTSLLNRCRNLTCHALTSPFGRQGRPGLTQILASEPEASFEQHLRSETQTLASCKHLTLTDNETTLDFDLVPINFGEGVTAARLDGTINQLYPVNGYIAIQRVARNTAMEFLHFQVGSSSSQDADRIHTLATDKATRTFRSP